MTSSSQTYIKLKYIPALDGLRGVAVCLVLLHHVRILWLSPHWNKALVKVATFGWSGVDIFFALSGFLITSILLNLKPGISSIKGFYLRRSLRIWPLYFGLLTAVCAEAAVQHMSYPWLRCLFFVQNLMPNWPELHDFNQTWSLCVEEHFYLIWPLAVFLLPRRALPWLLSLFVIGSPALRWLAIHQGIEPKLIYTASQYRFDGIALGSLLAVLLSTSSLDRRYLTRIGLICVAASVPALCYLVLKPTGYCGQLSATIYSVLAIISTGALCLALDSEGKVLGRILCLGPLRYVGKISYGLYMIHPLVFALISPRVRGIVGIFVAVSLSLLLSVLSWHLMESRLVRMKVKVSEKTGRSRHAEVLATVPESTG